MTEDLKYEGFPFISNIDGFVQNELANRALQRIRETNTPYIKITPGFTIDGTIGSKVILKGIESDDASKPSQYTFTDLYRPDLAFKPLAGVKTLNVSYLNAMGSIKKATFTWVCHTLDDLERLSPYFLTPGVTMFIEYGWSDYASKAIQNGLTSQKINLSTYLPYVRNLKKITNGNYDAMLGIVVNYSFTLNNDGGFDCTTEVVSAGYVMEGMTVPNQHTQDTNSKIKTASTVAADEKEKKDNEQKNKTNADAQTDPKVLKTLEYFLNNDFAAQLSNDYASGKFNDATCDGNKHDYFIYSPVKSDGIAQLVNTDTGKKLVSSVTVGSTTAVTELQIPQRTSIYVTWGYLEDYVLNSHIAIDVTGTEDLLFGFDSRGSKIASHKYLRTTDLGVCIIPIPNPGGGEATLPDFRAGDTSTTNSLDFGYVRRILINVQYFKEVFLSATTVNDGVMQIFSGINNSCINFWGFRLVPIEERYDDTGKVDASGTITSPSSTPPLAGPGGFKPSSELPTFGSPFTNPATGLGSSRRNAILAQKIVDLNFSDALYSDIDPTNSKNGLYVMRTKSFKVNNKEVTSVVRHMVFQSKLSAQAALNVFYAAQNGDGRVMGSPSNNTFQSMYNLEGVDYSKATDTFSMSPYFVNGNSNPDGDNPKNTNDVTDPGTVTEPFIRAMEAYGDALAHYLPWKEKGYWIELKKNGKTINLTGQEGMKMAVLAGADGTTPPSTSESLVPLECEVELEGISGIKIGNIFTIDHIPQIYQNHGTFQVIGITDTVDKNSWVTKLKCGFRVLRNVDYNKAMSNRITTTTNNNPSGIKTYKDTSFVTPAQRDAIIKRIKEIWMDKSIEGFAVSEKIASEAATIAQHESGFRVTAVNATPPDDSYGLFQVNMIKKGVSYGNSKTKYDLYGERTKWTDLGIIKDKQSVNPSNKKTYTDHNLWDMDTNIKVAKRIFKAGHRYSWHPWATKVALDSNRQDASLKSEITV